jgi:hypothetical protein
MRFENDKIICEGIVAEGWVVPLKNFLESIAPAKVTVDLTTCKDMHTAIAQLLIAYAGMYGVEYNFSDGNFAYKSLLQGAKLID